MFPISVPAGIAIAAYHPSSRDPEARRRIAAEARRQTLLLARWCRAAGLPPPTTVEQCQAVVKELGLPADPLPGLTDVITALARRVFGFEYAPAPQAGRPSDDRTADIIAAIRAAGVPLTRPELVRAMRLKAEGKLGAQLAWLVRHGILINIPGRGYWPAADPISE